MEGIQSQLNSGPINSLHKQANQKEGKEGKTHRIIFLPKFFTLPGGKLELENTKETYSTQRVLVQMPQREIFLENMFIYPGPIEIESPREASCLVLLDPRGQNHEERVVRLSVEVPAGTTLRFWPYGSNGQIITDEYELQARSKHAVRGEINGNHIHLLRNLYEMISREERKLFFRGQKSDLRRMAILRAALKAENTRKEKLREFRINIPDSASDEDDDSPFPLCQDQCDCAIL